MGWPCLPPSLSHWGALWYSASVMTYAIDTHASIKRLADAGVPDNQAEALVELMAQQHEDVATKADIAAIQSATKADMAALQSATKIDIAALQSATEG